MHDQPVIEPYEASTLFDDSSGSRPLLEGTVARGNLRQNQEFYSGLTADDQMVTALPVAVTRDMLLRGRSKFDTFCSPCHDRTGNGLGMIVRRGFKQPASFHDERLRQQPVGYFYSVISNGFGEMSSYASQIAPGDRWAIVAYLRTLQWSREVPLQSLSGEVRFRAETALSQPPGTEPESGHGAE
jgi:mono/diheme cytochrome c family protein